MEVKLYHFFGNTLMREVFERRKNEIPPVFAKKHDWIRIQKMWAQCEFAIKLRVGQEERGVFWPGLRSIFGLFADVPRTSVFPKKW